MKIFGIIKLIILYLLSIVISGLINLPTGIVGMLFLVVLLKFNYIKLSEIDWLADFALKHLSFFFVPFAVAVFVDYVLIKDIVIPYLVILVLSTVATMVSSGLVGATYLRRTKHD